MSRRFWRGFAAGAAAGAGAGAGLMLLTNVVGRARNRRVVRLEKALQIGRPVPDVFSAWAELERLPQLSDIIQEVRRHGNRSHWRVRVDGRTLEWDARVEQFIPNQAIGWKSLSGPKHSGRITFSPIGADTLIQVTVNYAPPSPVLKPFVENVSGRLDGYIERVLRDFKAALEGKGQEGRKPPLRTGDIGPGTGMTQSDAARATGTFGAGGSDRENELDRFGNRTNPVEYTRPPDARS